VLVVGDIRDGVDALLGGRWGDAFWSAVGFVPAVGDAAKIGKKVRDAIAKFPGRKAEALALIYKLFPSGKLRNAALDAATDGGASALRNGGLSDDAIEQLARKGNDLRRLADNARLGARTLDRAEAKAIDDAVATHWPRGPRSEAVGVETALAELRKDPNIEILHTGRPGPGKPVNGPDIVAVDRSTGRTIVVEAKNTDGGKPLSRTRLRSTADRAARHADRAGVAHAQPGALPEEAARIARSGRPGRRGRAPADHRRRALRREDRRQQAERRGRLRYARGPGRGRDQERRPGRRRRDRRRAEAAAVSWGVNLEDLAAARDALVVEVGGRPGSHAIERLARAHRWLEEEDAARARFREAAAAAEAVLARWGREDPAALSRIGSLLLRAGDTDAAAPWLERAAGSARGADDAAALSYLRGDYAVAVEGAARAVAAEGRGNGGPEEGPEGDALGGGGATGGLEGGALGGGRGANGGPEGGALGGGRGANGGPEGGALGGGRGATGGPEGGEPGYPWAEAVGALARARRDRDAARAGEAFDRFAALIGAERTPPDEESGSSGLSLFDWLEEAARARAELEGGDAPAHAQLLERAGLLRAERGPERAPPPPDFGPSRPGTATIAYPSPDGGEVSPSVTVDDDGDIHFVLHPARDLRASLLQHDGMWRARLGDEDLPGTFRGPRGAKRAIWDPLREQPDGQWAVALLDRLFRESFRLP
jgi:hypothetical protein